MTEDLHVLYNDTCPICSREIAAYRRTVAREGLPIVFEGLSRTDPARWGLTPDEAARRLHARRPDGSDARAGLDAFVAVWRQMPRLRWLARLVSARPVRPIADWTYERVLAPILFRWHQRRMRRQGAKCSPSSTTSTPRS